MKISIIIPNYNGLELLQKNLPKVFERISEEHKEFELIIIDDASSDKSLVYLEKFAKEKSKVKIIANDNNLGFSKSVNKAVRESTSDVFLLFNSDVYPEKGFLAPLLKHFDDPDLFAVGCLDKSIEGGKIVERGRGLGEFKRGLLVHRAGDVNMTSTLWVGGGSGAFRKSIWEKLSGLSELYSPFYWEDIDISYRAIKSGYKITFEPKSKVVHEHEAGSIRTMFAKGQVKAVVNRNQFIFIWQNVTDFDIILSHIVWMPCNLLLALGRGDVYFIKGFLKALLMTPAIVGKRFSVKKTFIKKDKEVVQSAQ